MRGSWKWFPVIFSLFCFSAFANNLANDQKDPLVRWTGSEDRDASLEHILSVLNQKLHTQMKANDFVQQEDRDLAFNHYRRYVQLLDQVPIHGKFIRVWTNLTSGEGIQVEANVALPQSVNHLMLSIDGTGKSALEVRDGVSSEKTVSLIREVVTRNSQDPYIQGLKWKDEWIKGRLIRQAQAKGKHGYHRIEIDLRTKKVLSYLHQEFPQADQPEEFSIPAQVFPVYEEVESDGTRLSRIPTELRHIYKQVPQANADIYASLKNQHYYDFKFDPVLGETESGRADGYWSMHYVKEQASKIRDALPLVSNDWNNGVLLQGKFATINIHPDALKKFGPLDFQPGLSAALMTTWGEASVDGQAVGEMLPSQGYAGKPLYSAQEVLDRPARRLPDHDPKTYLNDGFDEIQVYYAINTLFEELHSRGFVDPDLSTRPFNAFLFNPDIAYRDNAFYEDDTINFTTYSPKASNYARDNSTIWHELGHGVMDRLMGDSIELADTGGLSEGMADFVAAMVIQAVTDGSPFPGSTQFRIINRTGFYLTNEVHDDGEAYGGAMKDFMDAVIQKYGQSGLNKVADVVLEAMRLTRDYPGLTAPVWFDHIVFADSLGRPGVREPGELKPFLLAALAGRNFKLDGSPTATFTLVNSDTHREVVAGSPGSRDTPIRVNIAKNETASFQLQASLKGSDSFKFSYPVQVKVQFEGGPLQGAVHWVGEENGTKTYTLQSESDVVNIPLQASGTCDQVNREDGSCVDFAYVQIWDHDQTDQPVAKKRFYLSIKN